MAQLPWEGVMDAQIIPMIQRREKLGKPELAPDVVYDMMLRCWKLDPLTRISPNVRDCCSFLLYGHYKRDRLQEIRQCVTACYASHCSDVKIVWPRAVHVSQV